MKRKILSLFIAAAMILTLIPVQAFAEETVVKWQMICSNVPVTAETAGKTTCRDYITVESSANVYLYLVRRTGVRQYDYSTLEPLDTDNFNIQYLLTKNGEHSDNEGGLSIARCADGKADNYYTIKVDNSLQSDFYEGCGIYDVWAIHNDKTRLIYNFAVYTDESLMEGEHNNYCAQLFSTVPVLDSEGKPVVAPDQLPLSRNIDITVSGDGTTWEKTEFSRYIYLGTYYNNKLVSIKPMTCDISLKYLMKSTPTYDEDNPVAGVKDDSDPNNVIYTFELDPSIYNGYKVGRKEYEPFPSETLNSMSNSTIRVSKKVVKEVLADAEYDLTLEMLQDPADYSYTAGRSTDRMWVNGQGSSLTFTDKISYWDTCFFVRNAKTGYDARFDETLSSKEVRTYIGGSSDFIIEASPVGKEDWKPQTSANHIFDISYTGYKKGFSNVFRVTCASGDAAKSAMKKYQYRIRYTGSDPYLGNGNSDNRNTVSLIYEDNLPEFELDMSVLDGSQWNVCNYWHMDVIGSEINMKKLIRPGVLKSVEDKRVYDLDDYVYLKNEAADLKFYRQGAKGLVELSEDEHPFTVTWNPAGYYSVKYDRPENDMWGPAYYMVYTGDYNSAINSHYGTEGEHYVSNLCEIITGKLTVRVEEIEDDLIDAETEEEINETEVIITDEAKDDIDDELSIDTNQGDVTFTGDVVENIENSSGDVSFEITDVTEEDYGLTDAQQTVAESCEAGVDLSLETESGDISFGEDGAAEITLPVSGTDETVYYVSDDGKLEEIPSVIENGEITFEAEHFSMYVVAKKNLRTVLAKRASLKKVKPSLTLTTKGVKKGVKVKVNVPAKQKNYKTGIVIYRSTKKNSGYVKYKTVKMKGTSYTVTNSTNTKGKRLSKGQRYYYKVRAYRVIDGKTYYGPVSSVKSIKAV